MGDVPPFFAADSLAYNTNRFVAGYAGLNFDLFGGVRNLFEERYATLGFLTIDQFGGDLPLRFPGSERTFQAGIRWRGASAGAP